MSFCKDMMPPWEMKAELDRQAAEIERLRDALAGIADLPTGYNDMNPADLVISLASRAQAALDGIQWP